MPVTLQWHPSSPVLHAIYSGILSSDEYYSMCDDRLEMLESGPEQAILLANTQQFEGFPAATTIEFGENVLTHERIYCTLIVLENSLYNNLSRTMVAEAQNQHVYFFQDADAALAFTRKLVG